ncbi:aspartate carbamoyltransferase regulatory subunit [Neisseria sp. HMSC071C03]|jgi:aspartate carbamoyltransferase, regulatory subunit|uniref:Aspartate carbamoyltransferase regulatory chain n=1 Tax=Morococcus cerebrosus TaxID=1056807 RepID=A0A0C1H3B8_9NEIS|nr:MULTISPECIES: aspartate carbamoyltransferase regulatory subunit [Neisseriaceae]MBS6046131.1 aspartate carbamoyltransferase regulatory subunit [Neisseria sp.]OFJ58236.1 aspartate carbamoyltransferase regulatory subunit [Neisseria sp. HMSC073B07]OHR43780.1 aspartate carbamoyltransferase regulatory subunit [Neisseria sp. HMSC071B12]OHR45140.1 aspartate carbamoyltransferase regulatory subunit [Neisseria sp. HMSC071C03]KIC08647.1 aspartate carbamoyltransferase [Morococcus cerebrosus]
METPKLSVEAIEKGTVIDHIPAGKGLIILRQFKLLHYGSAVTVGFNLPSKTQGSKDIIKITGVWLDDNAANRLALFAPEAVVNTIDHFKVINKRRLTLPDEIAEVFRCPNTNCASHGEPVKSRFYVRKQSGQTKLKCHYCEKTFSRDSVTEA